MAKEKAYNPRLHQRLVSLIQTAERETLYSFLNSQSHSSFRSIGTILSVHILPDLKEDDYWRLFADFCVYNSKAFLVTFLKAAPARMSKGGFSLGHPGFKLLSAYWNEHDRLLDKQKFFLHAFPLLACPEQADYLLHSLELTHPETVLSLLLRCETTPLFGFVLFQTLRRMEHNKALLYRCCSFLMKRGDSLSFNLVSFFKVYFDLPELNGTFSLSLESYQLSYVEQSYKAFVAMLQSI